MNRSLRLFTLLPLIATPLFAQDAPPVDVQALLNSLQKIQGQNTVSTKAQHDKVLQDFRAAAESNAKAIGFYEEAVRATLFGGPKFQEWKKKEGEKLRSNEMQTAVRLHLTYLTLSLQYANGTPVSELLPALFNYTNQVLALREDPVKREAYDRIEISKKGISDSIFIRWYGVEKAVADLKDWENNPMNVDGIYQATILPQMRKDKDARIVQYWDMRLQREAKLAVEGKLPFNADQFNLIQRPNLLWSRAEDLLAIGQRNRAINEMFAVVKNFPSHPEAGGWISKLQALLAPSSARPKVVEAKPDHADIGDDKDKGPQEP